MTTEIRKEIREYIIEDVNITLSRLGISEALANEEVITDNRTGEIVRYEYTAKNIKQLPVMVKTLNVEGDLKAWKPREKDPLFAYVERFDFVYVDLFYHCEKFNGGTNGYEIGYVIYMVDKDLPDNFESELFDKEECVSYYVRKAKGLAI